MSDEEPTRSDETPTLTVTTEEVGASAGEPVVEEATPDVDEPTCCKVAPAFSVWKKIDDHTEAMALASRGCLISRQGAMALVPNCTLAEAENGYCTLVMQ